MLRVHVFGRAPDGKRNDGGRKAVTDEQRDCMALRGPGQKLWIQLWDRRLAQDWRTVAVTWVI